MNCSLLLCEGKMDAGLLGFWLRKRRGFVDDPAPDKKAPINIDHDLTEGTFYDWLARPNEDEPSVLVMGVGGFTNLLPVLTAVVRQTNLADPIGPDAPPVFEKVCVVWDCDEDEPDARRETLAAFLEEKCGTRPDLELGQWARVKYKQAMKRPEREVGFLPIQFPPDKHGCLETCLHEAIKGLGGAFAHVANCVDQHMANLGEIEFLKGASDKHKATLGADLVAILPDWSLAAAHSRIRHIDWTNDASLVALLEGLDSL